MKKIIVLILGVAMGLMMTVVATAPAQASSIYNQNVSCSGSNAVSGYMTIYTFSDGSTEIHAQIYDGGASAPHNWDVWLYRNDTAIRTDHVTGDHYFLWFPDNTSGLTDWKFRFANNARTINCTAEILTN